MIRVLYVDDEPDLLALGKVYLEQKGTVTVDTAESAQRALEMLRIGAYDVVVSDLQMSGMDGIALLKQIRAGNGDLPFILYTGRGREDVVIEALNNGADFYLQKGGDLTSQFTELHNAIARTIEKRENEEKLQNTADQSLFGVCIIQGDRFLHVNARFAELFGYFPDEIVSTLCVRDLVSPEDRDMVTANTTSRFPEESKSLHYAFKGRRKDGTDIDMDMDGTRMIFHGQPAIVGTVRGIMNPRQADRNLILANRNDALINMLFRHDITNQLTILRGRLRQIRKQCPDPVTLRQLETVDAAGRSIYNLLESARVYQEVGMSSLRWLNIHDIIEKERDHLRITTMHVSLMVNGIEIRADSLIDRVFANLLDNTMRHGIHATMIRVSFRISDEGLTLIWEDDGVGVPVDLKERIFEQGFGSNTGLGLFLCREILSGAGMSMRENGIPGTGARFEITVPGNAWRHSGNPLVMTGDHQTEKTNTSS